MIYQESKYFESFLGYIVIAILFFKLYSGF